MGFLLEKLCNFIWGLIGFYFRYFVRDIKALGKVKKIIRLLFLFEWVFIVIRSLE